MDHLLRVSLCLLLHDLLEGILHLVLEDVFGEEELEVLGRVREVELEHVEAGLDLALGFPAEVHPLDLGRVMRSEVGGRPTWFLSGNPA